ncbi:hypothetical protein [Roseimaritima ulvae]|uniref:Uncharacterized protein n=1 Tax=Roseimaritima ulvae TaxID=980254 RepID=A0A5B9QSU1_9BACT|nr:hypothetical protein [Roseimaritima ulvae]QEG40989.1 hypothetical protein UC8_30070 [Roseimaritima ulvae]
MSAKRAGKSGASWINDWRVHAASGAVLLLIAIAVLASKRIGGENRRAARPMNPTLGARLDGEFKPRAQTPPATRPPAAAAGMNRIQRNVPAASGTSVAITVDAGWLSELPSADLSTTDQPPESSQPLHLSPGRSLALAIQLPDQPAADQPLAIQIGDTPFEVRASAEQSTFVCRGQALGKLPNADGKLVLLIHREPAAAGESEANVLRWVLAAGDAAVAGRVELDGLPVKALFAVDTAAESAGSPSIAAIRFGSLPSVPEVSMPAVRFSR